MWPIRGMSPLTTDRIRDQETVSPRCQMATVATKKVSWVSFLLWHCSSTSTDLILRCSWKLCVKRATYFQNIYYICCILNSTNNITNCGYLPIQVRSSVVCWIFSPSKNHCSLNKMCTCIWILVSIIGDIDDRPLAASAFKAWLGSPERSKLEEKVESAYQRHSATDKRHTRSKSESEGKKSKVWRLA